MSIPNLIPHKTLYISGYIYSYYAFVFIFEFPEHISKHILQFHSEEYRLAGQQLRRNDARILITETVTTTSIQQKNPASTEQCLRDFFI